MKVLIDTNVWLSYLLPPTKAQTVAIVVSTCFLRDEIDIVVPRNQLDEFASKVVTKSYFRTHIPNAAIEHFIKEMTAMTDLLPPLEEVTAYSRDPKDDYLVEYGVVNEADYLITGDLDLLVLGRVGTLQIVKPSQFVEILREQNLLR
jgi:uncharacterized protein